jgi:hypothetical protein
MRGGNMAVSKARARLDAWLADAEEVLAEQRSQSISPSLYGSQYSEQRKSTLTLHEFEEALPEALGLLSSDPGRWILIVEDTASFNRYVQLIAFEDGSLMAEAVSNINLRTEEQWDSEHEELLARIGWSPPEVGVEDGDPNWWVWFPVTTPPMREVARMLLCTVRTVFGLRGRDKLTVKMFSSPKRGRTPASEVVSPPSEGVDPSETALRAS